MAIFDGAPAPKRSHAVLGNRRLRLKWLKITTNDLHALEGFHAQRMIWSCLRDSLVMLKARIGTYHAYRV